MAYIDPRFVHEPGSKLGIDVLVEARGVELRSSSGNGTVLVVAEPSTDRRAPTDHRGVDRTQIRALLRLTPTERMRRLVEAANNLIRLRKNARRV